MATPVFRDLGGEWRTLFGRMVRPPVHEARFWAVQAMVVFIAVLHLVIDLHVETREFPDGLPVALLIIPVSYAALRYGLSGSAATGLWATLLWLPDLLLPHEQGHTGSDLVNLALVDTVAFVIGARIEAERVAHGKAAEATAKALVAESRYRHLFASNRSPILVLDAEGRVADANPAAEALFGKELMGSLASSLLGTEPSASSVQRLNGRDYRLRAAAIGAGHESLTQLVLEDVTEERAATDRASHYAWVVVQAEEDQRRRLARELHDEPLQFFLYLARRLDVLALRSERHEPVADDLRREREEALQAAARLRDIARSLRPPALDQLGLLRALSSFVDDCEEEAAAAVELVVVGRQRRLPPDVELGAFRIAQEAVRNALRHAEAHSILLEVRFDPESVRVQVRDDGRGFDPESVRVQVRDDGRGFDPGSLGDTASDHLGILGMAERARGLGGTLEVRSAPGAGTTVEARLPATARAAGDQPPSHE
jgi:signal transduction histidine kinase